MKQTNSITTTFIIIAAASGAASGVDAADAELGNEDLYYKTNTELIEADVYVIRNEILTVDTVIHQMKLEMLVDWVYSIGMKDPFAPQPTQEERDSYYKSISIDERAVRLVMSAESQNIDLDKERRYAKIGLSINYGILANMTVDDIGNIKNAIRSAPSMSTIIPLIEVDPTAVDGSCSYDNMRYAVDQVRSEYGEYLVHPLKGISMEPAFKGGDWVVSIMTPFDEIKKGDVIAFSHPTDGNGIMHRVIYIGDDYVVAKGDNNLYIDPYEITESLYITKTSEDSFVKTDILLDDERPHEIIRFGEYDMAAAGLAGCPTYNVQLHDSDMYDLFGIQKGKNAAFMPIINKIDNEPYYAEPTKTHPEINLWMYWEMQYRINK